MDEHDEQTDRKAKPAAEGSAATLSDDTDAKAESKGAEPSSATDSVEAESIDDSSAVSDSGASPPRRDGDGTDGDAADSDAADSDSSESDPAETGKDGNSTDTSASGSTQTAAEEPEETLFWRLAPYLIAAAFIIELVLFGMRGDLNVCVAKKGAHDFDLMGQEKTDENRWRFPYCEARLNIGFVSRYEEQVADARNAACRRATMLQYKREGKDCTAGRQHWEMRVQAEQVAPWERRFYRRLIGLE